MKTTLKLKKALGYKADNGKRGVEEIQIKNSIWKSRNKIGFKESSKASREKC